MTVANGARRRVAFWCYELHRPTVDALAEAGFEVCVQLQGNSGLTPGHELLDLFLGRGLPDSSDAVAPRALPADVLWEYACCIARVNAVPRFGILDTSRVGPVIGDTVADWAQFHYRNAVAILRHYAVDELWLIDIPHLGVDNMFVEAALELGIGVLVLRQSALPRKFDAFALDRQGWHEVVVEGFDPIDPKHVFDPVIPVKRTGGPRGPGTSSLLASLAREFLGSPRAAVRRMYLGASRRDWSWLRFLIECVDPVSRPLATYRFARWVGRPRPDARSRARTESERSKSYVLFALHYEPEANVRAFSGLHANQVNAIEAIAAWIPEDWILLVKENPLQRGYARDPAFHLRLSKLRNVRFVDPGETSSELVFGAALVATIVGTIGFEALMAGRPCVYFGMPWYRHLPGAHRFKAGLDLHSVLASSPLRGDLARAIVSASRRMPDGVVFPRFLPQDLGDAEHEAIARTTARSLVKLRREAR